MTTLELQPGDAGNIIASIQSHLSLMEKLREDDFNVLLRMLGPLLETPVSSKAEYIQQLEGLAARVSEAARARS